VSKGPQEILAILRQQSAHAKLKRAFTDPPPLDPEQVLAEARGRIAWLESALSTASCHGSVVQLGLKMLMQQSGTHSVRIEVKDLPDEHQDLGVESLVLELQAVKGEDGDTQYCVGIA
jgi:hypothetical protein